MRKNIRLGDVQMSTVGLDLADKYSDWVALSGEGEVVVRQRVRTTEPELRKTFGAIKPTVMAIEVGTHSWWVSRVLSDCGHRVVIANARKVALIHKNKRKNNSIDAETLARLGRADERLLYPVTHRDERSHADLAVLRSRDLIIGARTKLINHVRGCTKVFGVQLAKCSAEAFVNRCKAVIPASVKEAIEPVLGHIDGMSKQIDAYDKQIAKMIVHHPAAQQLMEIKGVGPLTAMAFVLTIEDPQRIGSSRSTGAYFGLVPGSDDSGETHTQRRITKEGDRLCRRLLVLAGHYILGRFGPDTDLRRHGLAIAARGGKNAKKRAVVAVARKLAVVMHHLWLTGERYIPLFNADHVAAA
jgi:transposase